MPLVLALASLAFIYSAQIFQNKAWANVFTTVGSAMLSLVSLYVGGQLQQMRERQSEQRRARKEESGRHREYLEKIGNLLEQIRRYQHLVKSGRRDESDLMWYKIQEKIADLQGQRPTTNNISDRDYRVKIQQAIGEVWQILDKLSDEPVSNQWIKDLESSVQRALAKLIEYENAE